MLHEEIENLKKWKNQSIAKITEYKNCLQKIKYLELQRSLLQEKLDLSEEQKGEVLVELGKTQKDNKIMEMENFGLKSENDSFRVMASRCQTPNNNNNFAASTARDLQQMNSMATTVQLDLSPKIAKKKTKKFCRETVETSETSCTLSGSESESDDCTASTKNSKIIELKNAWS